MLQDNVDGVVESQVLINQEIGENKASIKRLDKSIKNLQTNETTKLIDIRNLKFMNQTLQTELARCKREINDLEQYGRRSMVDIHVPRTNEENTDKIVQDIGKLINVPLEENDIEVSHRVLTNQKAPIIVKFSSRKVRDEFFKNRNKLKNFTTTDLGYNQELKIFINESLTAYNGAVLKKARKDLQAEGFKHVWTKNGKTFARKNDNSRKYVIHTL